MTRTANSVLIAEPFPHHVQVVARQTISSVERELVVALGGDSLCA